MGKTRDIAAFLGTTENDNTDNVSLFGGSLDSAEVLSITGRGTTSYDDVATMISSDPEGGTLAFVTATNKMYFYNGSGWSSVTVTNATPVINSVQDSDGGTTPFALSTDGTPTTITIDALDSDGFPLTYSYGVTSGSLGNTATVSQDDNVFTITPSSNDSDAGDFTLTFTVSDGVEEVTSANEFSLAFVGDWSAATLTHTLDNPNAYGTSAYDRFGTAVSISGDRAIVGAEHEDDAGGGEAGKAYIFNATTGALVHTLDNPNAYGTSQADFFGGSVAISGNYAIVGAEGEDDASGTTSGKAYIFNVTTGALVHTLDNPNPYGTSASDQFGTYIAIDGDYAIVSAFVEDDAGGLNSGKAYIYNVTTGALVHTLDNPNAYNTTENDFFGSSVAISGNYAIIGALREDDAGGTTSGKAYIFNVTTGALVHTLDNPNAYGTSDGDAFGVSSAISGDRAIVGAWWDDYSGGIRSGKAYIYNVTTGALLHTLDNPNGYGTRENDWFGFSVAISGNYAVVGAYQEDDAGGTESGKAYIFDVSTGALVKTLDNPNAYGTSAGDKFGFSVSISGNRVIVSSEEEDDAGGTTSSKAYIFTAG